MPHASQQVASAAEPTTRATAATDVAQFTVLEDEQTQFTVLADDLPSEDEVGLYSLIDLFTASKDTVKRCELTDCPSPDTLLCTTCQKQHVASKSACNRNETILCTRPT